MQNTLTHKKNVFKQKQIKNAKWFLAHRSDKTFSIFSNEFRHVGGVGIKGAKISKE
jgi:hypothetical protein